MAGQSAKRGFARCPGHPCLSLQSSLKTWMPGTSSEARFALVGYDD
jgi:hypothetical protein